MNSLSNFLSTIRSGRPAVGTGVALSDPTVTDLLSQVGYDFLFIDMEHNPFTLENVHAHLLTLSGTSTAALVRVPANSDLIVKPLLELVPVGLIFPMICTADQAAEVVAACKYPPVGKRGFGPRRGIGYGGKGLPEYLSDADNQTLVIIQIEHREGVENLDAILAVEGVDGVCIGPMDLTASLDCLGQFEHPRYLEALDEIIAKVKTAGLLLGVSTGFDAAGWIARGMQWISYSVDTNMLGDRSRQLLGQIRKIEVKR